MSERFENLIRRYSKARSRGLEWQNHFEDLYDLFMPNRNIAKESARGQRHNITVYDITGILATRSFVSLMHNGLTPLGVDWMIFEAGIAIPPPLKNAVDKGLRIASDKVNQFIRDSNFHLAISEAYADLAIGTGSLIVNEGDSTNPLIFEAVPLLRVFPESSPFGDIRTVWYDMQKVPIRDIDKLWPKAIFNTKIPESINMQVQTDPNAEINLITGTVWNKNTQKYDYVVLDEKTKSFLVDVKMDSSPWIIFRGFKRAGETYGRGPCDQAFPTMATLNAVVEDELKAGRLRANPIFMGASDGVFNPWTAKLEPWSIIPINNTSVGQLPLAPVPMSGDPQFRQVQVQELRDMINKIFFTDPLGPINPTSQLTATEIMLRNQEQLEQKIPFVGRIQFELLDKLTERILFILQKKGLIPPIMIGKQELALQDVVVKYKSPLIQTQGIQNVNNFVKFNQVLQSIFGPQLAIMGLDSDQIPNYLANQLEIDPKLVRSPADLEILREKAEQAAQQQPQLPGAPMGGIPPTGAAPSPPPGAQPT